MKDTGADNTKHKKHVPRQPRRGPDETRRLGKEIYVRDIRHLVEPEQIGKIIAIDVDSRCWALGESAT